MRLPLDLDPSTDQARQWLTDELARSEYHDTRSLFQRLMDWVMERLGDLQSTQGAGGVSLPPIVITLVVVLLVIGAGSVLTKVRIESKTVSQRRTLLGDTVQTAEQLRREAEQAMSDGRFGDALVAWTRAMAREAERRTLLPDIPSMTAREVGAALSEVFPGHVDAIGRTIGLFDEVAYGDAEASRDDAMVARSTDEGLKSARPTLARPRSSQPPGGPPPDQQTSVPDRARDESSVWMTGMGS